MPIYEYECQQCKDVTEVMQKMTEPAPEHCASCGKGPLQKIMSRTSFALKGQGWFNPPRSDPKPESKPDAKAGAKVDAKDAKADAPATKPAETKAEPAPAAAESKPSSPTT